MSTTFESLWRELSDWVPQLGAKQAQKFVTRAWADICNSSHWSFLQARTIVHIPASIETGTVSITQNSSTITFDADAIAVLDAVGMASPVTQRQIQFGGSGPYQLLTYAPVTGVATITPTFPTDGTNPGYLGSTDTAASYILAKRYYAPPDPNFLRWVSVINQVVPYRFWTGTPVSIIDLYDPKRQIQGNPYVIAQFVSGIDPAGSGAQVPLYELWPCPQYDTQMTQIYQKKVTDFDANTDTLPNDDLTDLLMLRAKYRAAEWASANAGRFPELKGSNWLAMMQMLGAEFKEDLWRFKKQDRETFANAAIVSNNVGYYASPMWDASYSQISSLNADIYTGQFGFPI